MPATPQQVLSHVESAHMLVWQNDEIVKYRCLFLQIEEEIQIIHILHKPFLNWKIF